MKSMKRIITAIALILGFAGVSWADISTGLVSYWPLNQNWVQNSTTVSDIGSGGNHGTLEGNPVVGAESTAFDGTGDYVNIGDVSDLNFERTDPFSISAWVKVVSGNSATIVSKRVYGGFHEGWDILVGSGGYFTLTLVYLWAGNALHVRGGTDIADNTKHHVVVSYDGSSSPSGVALYVDNSGETEVTLRDTLAGTIQTNADVQISGRGGPWVLFTGSISDVRIYNRVLSPDDVAELYLLGPNAMGAATLAGVTLTGVTIN